MRFSREHFQVGSMANPFCEILYKTHLVELGGQWAHRSSMRNLFVKGQLKNSFSEVEERMFTKGQRRTLHQSQVRNLFVKGQLKNPFSEVEESVHKGSMKNPFSGPC